MKGPSSARAIANLSAICKNHFPDNHQVEIVDILQDPRRVLSDHILATPTLIKLSPAPIRKIIGELGEEAKVLLALGLQQPDHVKQSDETAIGNIGKLCGSHRLGSGGGQRFVHQQHRFERLCQGDDPSRCPRVHRRSVQLSGDGFDLYGHARWNFVVAWGVGESCLSVVNLNERNTESLCSLGLDQLFNVSVSVIKKDGQTLPIPLEENCTARAQTMLEAHEALIKTAPANLPKSRTSFSTSRKSCICRSSFTA